MMHFNATFHARMVVSKDQHDLLSVLVIQSLGVIESALNLHGVSLAIEDDRGNPRDLTSWIKVMHYFVSKGGVQWDFPEKEISLPPQFDVAFGIGPYPKFDSWSKAMLLSAIQMAHLTLETVGATFWVREKHVAKDGTLTYGDPMDAQMFAQAVLAGEYKMIED